MREILHLWRPAVCAVVLAAPLVGCSTTDTPLNPATDPVDESADAFDINDPDGGFDTRREAPGFGDPYLIDGEAEAVIDDPIADDPEVRAMLDDPDRFDVWGVRVTWGYLERTDENVTDPIDWSGGAKIADGVLVGVRAISFERRQGDRVRGPRSSRTEIGWTSTTTTAYDGIHLLVVDPNFSDVPNSILVEMPLFSESFAVPFDGPMDQVFDVDDLGHQVRVQIEQREPAGACRRGWVSGRWRHEIQISAADGVNGAFMGMLTNVAGDDLAAVRGFYGVNESGQRVMFGKIIDRDGNFRAFVRGTWSPSRDAVGAGSFRAGIVGSERDLIGLMTGVYASAPNGNGFFHGAWRTHCGDENPNDGEEDGEEDDDPTDGQIG